MTAQGKFLNRTDKGINLTPKGRALGIFSLLTAFGLLMGLFNVPRRHRQPTLLTCCTSMRRCLMIHNLPCGSKRPRPTYPSVRSRCRSPAAALPARCA